MTNVKCFDYDLIRRILNDNKEEAVLAYLCHGTFEALLWHQHGGYLFQMPSTEEALMNEREKLNLQKIITQCLRSQYKLSAERLDQLMFLERSLNKHYFYPLSFAYYSEDKDLCLKVLKETDSVTFSVAKRITDEL